MGTYRCDMCRCVEAGERPLYRKVVCCASCIFYWICLPSVIFFFHKAWDKYRVTSLYFNCKHTFSNGTYSERFSQNEDTCGFFLSGEIIVCYLRESGGTLVRLVKCMMATLCNIYYVYSGARMKNRWVVISPEMDMMNTKYCLVILRERKKNSAEIS